jgi:hypothetical protein
MVSGEVVLKSGAVVRYGFGFPAVVVVEEGQLEMRFGEI